MLPKPTVGTAVGRVTGGEGWKRPTAAGQAKQQGFGGETLKASVPGRGRGGKGITASPRRQWRGADLSLTKSPQRETLGRAPKAGAGREGGMRPPHGRSVSGPGAAAGPSRVPGPTSLTRASLPRVGLIGRAPPATTHARSRSPRSRNAEPKRRRSRSGSMTGCWRQTAPRRPPPPRSGPGAGGGSGTAPPPSPTPRAPPGSACRTVGLSDPPAGGRAGCRSPRWPCCVPAGGIPGRCRCLPFSDVLGEGMAAASATPGTAPFCAVLPTRVKAQLFFSEFHNQKSR